MSTKYKPIENVNLAVIRTPNFIGDTVMMLPALELLKQAYPNVKFIIFAPAINHALFRNRNDIADCIVDETKIHKGLALIKYIRSLKQKFKQLQPDIGLCYHNTLRDAFILKYSGIKPLLGFPKEGSGLFLDFSIPLDRERHYVNRFAALVNDYLQRPFTQLPTAKLYPNSQSKEYSLASNSLNIGLMFGTNDKSGRTYPHGFGVVRKLIAEALSHPKTLIFLGDDNDAATGKAIMDQLDSNEAEHVKNYAGKTSLGEHIDLIAALDLLICIDSSGMHIAAATSTPCVVLVGKGTSVFELVQPKQTNNIYLTAGESLIEEPEKLSHLKPEKIIEAVKQLLKRT